ncbi:TraB/GumN family protein [Paracoccus stylophorae]|uniref:TraB/GumN family protein n=1 Tax=Paracoccus stylophorae TaxID=659350 RepID=A0ABY7SS56_9RHOB|nr:TraB/GumN family protein [Paracoccus stylophorae]WCR09267.1 TraB/GumN family protein [Paracoccus stylophorae]
MRRIWAAAAMWTVLAGIGLASECVGVNLIEALPQDQRARLDDAVRDVPYHRGILWRATKGDARMTLVGTYHFGDPRHRRMLDRLAEPLQDAAALYVEAGPEEERRLTRALVEDPDLMVNVDGPTLPERLSDTEWQALARAMEDRGTPAVIAAKLRPWYVAMMLGVSPCMMQQAGDNGAAGLDRLLVQRAEDLDVPVRALEPWDTVFTLFGDMTPAQEIDMIRASLPAASHADDYAVTLTDAYFAGDVWQIWEFGRLDAYRNSDLTRAQVDEQMQLAQAQLMDARNQSWIGKLIRGAEEAAQQGRGIVAGFGALHLPGENGVLRLLEKRGWNIERLDR